MEFSDVRKLSDLRKSADFRILFSKFRKTSDDFVNITCFAIVLNFAKTIFVKLDFRTCSIFRKTPDARKFLDFLVLF